MAEILDTLPDANEQLPAALYRALADRYAAFAASGHLT
jgi:hypothetical protein